MVKKVTLDAARTAYLGGGYVSPEITRTVSFQPEGVMCFSVQGFEHEAFTTDENSYYEL